MKKKPNLKFSGKIGAVGVNAKKLDISGEFELDPVSAKPLLQFPAIAKALPPELSAEGPISLKTKFAGSFFDLSLDLSLNASKASVKYGKQFSKPAGMPFQIQFDGRNTTNTLEIKKSSIKLHTLDFTGNGIIQFSQNPTVKLAFKSGKNKSGWMGKHFPWLQRVCYERECGN